MIQNEIREQSHRVSSRSLSVNDTTTEDEDYRNASSLTEASSSSLNVDELFSKWDNSYERALTDNNAYQSLKD